MYYDEAREEAELRKKALDPTRNMDSREFMRSEIRRKWKNERKDINKKNDVTRIVIYAIFAFFVIYLVFFTNMVNTLVSLFLR